MRTKVEVKINAGPAPRVARHEPVGSSRAGGFFLWAFALALTALAALVAGAIAAHGLDVALARPPARAAVVAAGACGALFAVVLPPALFDRVVTGAYRRLSPGAPSLLAQTLALWAAVAGLAACFGAPRLTRAALEARGAWPLDPQSRGARGLTTAARWAAARLPLGSAAGGPEPAAASATGSAPTPPSSAPPGVAAPAAAVATSTPGGAPAPLAAASASIGGPVADAPAAPTAHATSIAPTPFESDVTPEELFRRRADTVVVLHVRQALDPDDLGAKVFGRAAGLATGSGFVVDAAGGLVVTNEHVIHDGESAEVVLRDGRTLSPVEVLVVDRAHDLALLRVKAPGLASAPLGTSADVGVGQRVAAIGGPLGLSYSLSDGMVSALRDERGTAFVQFQAAVGPGSSGGPVFDLRGRVVGVTTASAGAGQHFALPVDRVSELLAAPREPRALAPFADNLRVADLRLEGDELSPVERLQLGEILELMGAALEPCLEKGPRAARLAFRAGADADGLARRAARSGPGLTSNLGPEGEACARKGSEFANAFLAHMLTAEHGAALRKGKALVLTFRYEAPSPRAGAAGGGGSGGGEGDGGTTRAHVRYELQGARAGGAGGTSAAPWQGLLPPND